MPADNSTSIAEDLIAKLTWNGVTGFIVLCFLASLAILAMAGKWEAMPATLFTAVAAWFSYAALRYSREKFRLDLYEKRLEIYSNTVEFCSRVIQTGLLRDTPEQRSQNVETMDIAMKCFRGLGYHKSRALFGSDIHELFKKLNTACSYLSIYPTPQDDAQQQQWLHHHEFITKTVDELPHLFAPYMHFGDYRR